jgi:hypothetical protein
METAVRKASKNCSANEQKEPKRLSKFALWRQKNQGSMYSYIDWRAVNK